MEDATVALPPITGAIIGGGGGGGDIVVTKTGKGRGDAKRKAKKSLQNSCSASSSSSSSSSLSSSRLLHGGVRLRSRFRGPSIPRGVGESDSFQDLGLPLGMSFAAILSLVLDGKNVSRKRMPVDQLAMIYTSAIKESVHIIYGERFDCFMKKFEKSFASTLRTLQLINEASIGERGNVSVIEAYEGRGNGNCTSSVSSNCEAVEALRAPESLEAVEEFHELNTQLILHGRVNQQLAHVSHGTVGPVLNLSMLNTMEKSVVEQTRSNDLKEIEIGLTMRKLQLKESQLALDSYANFLDRVKVCMGFSKASFREEKLKSQMQDVRYAELLKSCIDLLVAGIVIMLCLMLYGTYIYSYRRITEATASCSYTAKESSSWWVPKQVSSFSSGWQILRCHVQVLTQMTFGLLMILAIAYSVFQRSATSGPTMPVTFILMLLGGVCGIAGKLCVDTLGGSGYCWLLYWEALCLLHFFANVFPSALYYILHGPVSVGPGVTAGAIPHWLRRYMFYSILLLVLPTMAGLLPFASFHDWRVHIKEKATIWSLGNEGEH